MVIRTLIAVAFLLGCVVVMNQVFWMLDQCVPSSKEAEAIARARRWKEAVAGVVLGAWVCAAGIVLGLHMSEVLRVIVFAGPAVITVPVLAWVLLGY